MFLRRGFLFCLPSLDRLIRPTIHRVVPHVCPNWPSYSATNHLETENSPRSYITALTGSGGTASIRQPSQSLWPEGVLLVPNDQDRDGRHAMARGYVLASRVMSIGFQMVVPAGLGWWADLTWKTGPWLLLLGVFVGFAVALFELVKLANDSSPSRPGDSSDRNQNRGAE